MGELNSKLLLPNSSLRKFSNSLTNDMMSTFKNLTSGTAKQNLYFKSKHGKRKKDTNSINNPSTLVDLMTTTKGNTQR